MKQNKDDSCITCFILIFYGYNTICQKKKNIGEGLPKNNVKKSMQPFTLILLHNHKHILWNNWAKFQIDWMNTFLRNLAQP